MTDSFGERAYLRFSRSIEVAYAIRYVMSIDGCDGREAVWRLERAICHRTLRWKKPADPHWRHYVHQLETNDLISRRDLLRNWPKPVAIERPDQQGHLPLNQQPAPPRAAAIRQRGIYKPHLEHFLARKTPNFMRNAGPRAMAIEFIEFCRDQRPDLQIPQPRAVIRQVETILDRLLRQAPLHDAPAREQRPTAAPSRK
jgi:hypothetical protein